MNTAAEQSRPLYAITSRRKSYTQRFLKSVGITIRDLDIVLRHRGERYRVKAFSPLWITVMLGRLLLTITYFWLLYGLIWIACVA